MPPHFQCSGEARAYDAGAQDFLTCAGCAEPFPSGELTKARGGYRCENCLRDEYRVAERVSFARELRK